MKLFTGFVSKLYKVSKKYQINNLLIGERCYKIVKEE
jgi:hypothetical protein